MKIITKSKQLLRVYDGMHKHLAVGEIKYLAGSINYSYIYLTSQHPILTPYPLKQMNQRLPDFIRIHKGYLVNPRFIPANIYLHYQSKELTLTTGEVLPIARRRLAELALLFSSD